MLLPGEFGIFSLGTCVRAVCHGSLCFHVFKSTILSVLGSVISSRIPVGWLCVMNYQEKRAERKASEKSDWALCLQRQEKNRSEVVSKMEALGKKKKKTLPGVLSLTGERNQPSVTVELCAMTNAQTILHFTFPRSWPACFRCCWTNNTGGVTFCVITGPLVEQARWHVCIDRWLSGMSRGKLLECKAAHQTVAALRFFFFFFLINPPQRSRTPPSLLKPAALHS